MLQRQTQQHGHISTGRFARRGRFRHRLCTNFASGYWRCGFGFFHVGGVVAACAVHNRVFTCRSNHLKFFTQIATDCATVGCHCAVGQAKAVKNFAVSSRHHLIAGFGARFVSVKRIRVFHDEFTPAHQAKAWAAFVAKLGLNLVQVFRQLFVTFEFLSRNVRHAFFTGGLHNEIAVVAVFDAQ